MSNDMSMFRKMKERITDEVSSATNKLQNMQIIDQLASSIGQQIKNDTPPNQLVPEPHGSSNSTNMPINSQFSLIDDGPSGGYNEEEELNSEFSPQHQLFNEHSIKRLNHAGFKPSHNDHNGTLLDNHNSIVHSSNGPNNTEAVINIYELSSDIEDGLEDTLDTSSKDGGLDVEIDLLSDKPLNNQSGESFDERVANSYTTAYKSKYRDIVHYLREIHRELHDERTKSQAQRQDFTNQMNALKTELELYRHQQNSNLQDSFMSNSTGVSENDKLSVGSPQPATKSSTKVKDLEKLLAKCKESLKLKNSQIKSLKQVVAKIENFQDSNEKIKCELVELREAHEFWTVSIAENKRIMHQEIEDKNSEMEKLRREISDLQNKISEGQNNNRLLKSAIQDLESRLVRTSAAHQKERESLTKELTAAKHSAVQQIRKESERNIERIKLDLEKSIENLKLELLNKDEQLIKSVEKQQQLNDQNQSLISNFENVSKQLQEQLKIAEEARIGQKEEMAKCSELSKELEHFRELSDEQEKLRSENEELNIQIKNLELKLKSVNAIKCELDSRLNELDKREVEDCESCENLNEEIKRREEQFQQELHELNVRLDLMTTANDDQEKEIKSLTAERNSLNVSHKSLRAEFEELLKKNESLARVIQENETDMQNQQEQLDRYATLNHDLDNTRKENSSLAAQLTQYKNELNERNYELSSLRNDNEELNKRFDKLKTDFDNTQTIIAELKKDKDSLASQIENYLKQQRHSDEQLVVRILSAMKNLETPTTSPGSDKSYGSYQQDLENKEEKNLPNPITLVEELSSLALDRSNAYMTTSQRLQAVLLENTMIGEELRRLKDELNNLNHETNLATQCSLEEAEKLRTENQALIHDQQAYDERITSLEEEVEKLNKRLTERSCDVVTDSTQFEYLKNIVHQFLLGKEPIVLARVIAAVFKFEKNQIDQICKIQEAIHASGKTQLS